MQIFQSISTAKIAARISAASSRIAIVAPAIWPKTAEAICSAAARLSSDQITVIVDCDEEVCRLGYGDIASLAALREIGVTVRQCSGLRIGVLICDDRAWVFSPTPLYLHPEVHSDETPNAVEIGSADVERLIRSISPESQRPPANGFDWPTQEAEGGSVIEIGSSPVSDIVEAKVAAALKIAPPLPFDVTRPVRVFQPYIQYVELTLRGCAIERRRIPLPRSLHHLGPVSDIQDRLRTTFDLIDRQTDISSGTLEQELKRIRDAFTRSLGPRWGRIMLRSSRPLFDKRVEALQSLLKEHVSKVTEGLSKLIEESRTKIVEHFLPIVQKSPPDALSGQLMTQTPDIDDIRKWLDCELRSVFPTPDALLSQMKLDVQYRDVTYETLADPEFGDAIRRAFPHIDWDKPFAEFSAAKERAE